MAGRLIYANHLKGSRAAYVHQAFDLRGPKAAFKEGEKQGVTKRTVQNWISQWKPADEKQKRAAAAVKSTKKVSKKMAKKAVKKAAKPAVKKVAKKVAPKAAKKSAPRGRVVKDVALNG